MDFAAESERKRLLTGVRPPKETVWGPTVHLRLLTMSFGAPKLQQKWIAVGGPKAEAQWRDVLVVTE